LPLEAVGDESNVYVGAGSGVGVGIDVGAGSNVGIHSARVEHRKQVYNPREQAAASARRSRSGAGTSYHC
jgi:hypothetical protein